MLDTRPDTTLPIYPGTTTDRFMNIDSEMHSQAHTCTRQALKILEHVKRTILNASYECK